jgi:UDP-N-acetyl-D-galactosamine dehydrogenase
MNEHRIAVIGLGYVGLPLAIEFGRKYQVLGFDINQERVAELARGEDRTKEADLAMLASVSAINGNRGLRFSYNVEELRSYNLYIVTVPTPINQFKSPDLIPLLKASEMLGKVLKKGDTVIYESTVYPGCTEEDSGLKFNTDFFCGYSPERINPGDKVNTLTKIKKVTSGSTPEIAETVDALYRSIITAGTHKAPSLKVAEASKAIENAQRDVNISFVNELALIFDRMGIDTTDVIEAAGTKWNFLKYRPGLVGGHCIGVDPYYLAHKAQSLGYHPQVILSGRRVNDNMGMFVANQVIKLLIKKGHKVSGAKALILGITFKEDCPDIRNSRVVDIYEELKQYDVAVDVFDPHADKEEVESEYNIGLIQDINNTVYDAVILAVSHKEFLALDYTKLKRGRDAILFDTKSFLDRTLVDARL